MTRTMLAALLAGTTLAVAGYAQAPAKVATASPELSLAAGFRDPPKEARPRVWWHWMNGNVTRDGIAKDLAWMSRVGIGGMTNFDASLGTPQIVDKRLVYMTPEWKDAFKFAASEAQRLDLELAIAASPGWSETGGPWVPPQDGMKKLVWSQVRLAGGKRFSGRLAAPPVMTGPYQTAKFREVFAMGEMPPKPEASGAVAVIAVPVREASLPGAQVTLADGTALNAGTLLDQDFETGVTVPLAKDKTGAVLITYARPVTVRSLRLFMPGLKVPFRGIPVLPVVDAMIGGKWIKVAELPLAAVPSTFAFDAVTASQFRIRVTPVEGPPISELDGAPGAIVVNFFDTGPLEKIALNDLQFSAEPAINRVQEKAGFDIAPDYYAIAGKGIAPVLPTAAGVIDLTDRVAPDGTIDWTPPKGSDWTIYRFGWSLIGTTNHPAPPEATGLEVDKYDAAAVRRYLETYIGNYRNAVGDDLFGKAGVRALLTDSIEAGSANWTPRLAEEFEARRGYKLRPWLPALTGVVIGSEAQTERFLYDFRRTLSELLADMHYRTVAEVAKEHGLIVYGEALEDKRPMLGDDLAMRRFADVPMAALWTWPKGGSMRTTLLGDMKGAASVAHVYGKRFVAAESMTAISSPWAFAPRDLKRFVDLELAYGINRPVIHTSVHVPVDDKQPGLSLAIFGQYFNRNETWAEMAEPWVKYISRSSYLLQHGRDYADVAWFIGEESPVTAQFAEAVPKGLPTRYGYDFVDAEMLANALDVEDGQVVSSGGARYRVIYLGGTSHLMTLPTLKRLAALVAKGAVVVGHKPEASPSLADDPAEFAKTADALWGDPHVIASDDVEAALAKLGVAPDVDAPGGDLLFVHRTAPDGEIYFVNNRADARKVEARFRITGRKPELWDPVSGTSKPLSYRTEGEATVVSLDLPSEGSCFVVFREATDQASFTVPAVQASGIEVKFAPWNVTFQPGRGAPESTVMASLSPLDRSDDAGIRYFSGVATYRSSFTLRA
ncbi:MAG: glycosyl hydrolase, partial [Sphingomonas sp.]